MKKSLCVTLAFLLLLSIALPPHAAAVANHCELFDNAINRLRWNAPYWDIPKGEAFPVASVMAYTRDWMCTDEYGENPVTEGGYSYYTSYAIPADVFEAAAMDFFAVVDVEALRSYTSFFWDYANNTGIDNFQNYQPDRQVYLFGSSGGMGDPSWYEVLGYTEEEGLYTVYSRFVSLMWEEPTGEEDYILIDGEYFEIEHYLRTVVAISNGQVQFYSWEEIETVPDVEMTTPSDFLLQTETITIEAAPGVFPADTVIEIRQPEADQLQAAQQALVGLAAQFVTYDIVASAQPDGTAKVTFAIPEGYDVEKLALFHITDAGEAQQLEIVVDAEAGTVTAQLTHFSLYALAQLADEEPLWGDANGDGTVNARDARLMLRYAAGLIGEEELALDTADFNGDGRVNARDARAVLLLVAGLN